MTISPDSNFGPTTSSMPSGAIVLHVGDNYQSIIDNAPNGATFWFEGGVHHLTQALDPKNGQTFLGAQGAVLDGSHEITSFQQEGGLFVASGQTQEGARVATDEGADGAMRAGFPETFFIDNKPLTPVDSLDKVHSGTFYFDYAADKIYFADNPAGHTVEAGNASAAFDSNSTGVTVQNLTIQKFDAPTQHGAIQGGENWTVANNEVRLNYGVGITVQGGSTISGNDVHDNGEMGLGGNGDNITVTGNDIHANGGWSGIDPTWEGGGAKFAQTDNLVVRDNYSHDNHGLGLWTDIDNIHTLYEGNLVVNNDNGGISHEISYDAVIRDNVVMGNGSALGGNWLWGSQIQLQNSQNVEVYDNKVDMSGGLNGIGLIQQDRGSGAYGEHTTTNNYIHDNTIVSSSGNGATGGVADYNEAGMLNGGNVFADNHYYMNDGDHWRWGDFPDGDNFEAYLKDSGEGQGSTLSSNIPDTSTWIDGGSTVSQPSTPSTPSSPSTPSTPSTPSGPSTPVTTPGDTGTGSTLPQPTAASINGHDGHDDIDGTVGNDTIFGLGGDDFLEGKAGHDLLSGGAGADTFFFDQDAGNDNILDFQANGTAHDKIALPDNDFSSVSQILAAAHTVGSDTVISYGGNQLTIDGVTADQLHADHFMIV
ncbi:right-handed parallel beta-helix repeat-containing protein [Jiella sp. M17.18]|uniref:right-handed parallel beta-helix repeat-containing protein n=1 Tax=Jiella sp. M17.18 TaxID=3234247 RepID=UPI0034DFB6D1